MLGKQPELTVEIDRDVLPLAVDGFGDLLDDRDLKSHRPREVRIDIVDDDRQVLRRRADLGVGGSTFTGRFEHDPTATGAHLRSGW